MISEIAIKNFKSLKNLQLPCGNLNLLTGMNGMGKSSVLQSLLLLRQSHDKGYLEKFGLTLKGDLVNIGVGGDALYQLAPAETNDIEFALKFQSPESRSCLWTLRYDADSDVLSFPTESYTIPQSLNNISLFNSKFQYLNAERWVKNQYERSDFQVVRNRNLGKHGEYTAHFLAHFGPQTSEQVHESLMYRGTTTRTLEYQVSAWMQEISPKTFVVAAKVPGVDAIKLSYEFETQQGRTNGISPLNVGFGITYALPVIVALLSSKPGDILLIENPESHLHAQGQSEIGRLMAMVAQLGVQIFVESHSDHILNGICVAIHQQQLSNELCRIHYFTKKQAEIETTSYDIKVNANGRLDDSALRAANVEGFFDRINKDLEVILFTNPEN